MEFPRQEYWSGLSFPPPGDLPNPGIKPVPPAVRWILYHGCTWEVSSDISILKIQFLIVYGSNSQVVLKSESESHSAVYDSLQPHRLYRGVLQARIWEWVAFPFSRGSSQLRGQTQVSHIAGGFFTV